MSRGWRADANKISNSAIAAAPGKVSIGSLARASGATTGSVSISLGRLTTTGPGRPSMAS